MTTVALSGYPEAVLGQGSILVDLPQCAVVGDVVIAVAAKHSRLGPALLHDDARPRRSTKVLIDGAVAEADVAVPAGAAVTVLAALPCDG